MLHFIHAAASRSDRDDEADNDQKERGPRRVVRVNGFQDAPAKQRSDGDPRQRCLNQIHGGRE